MKIYNYSSLQKRDKVLFSLYPTGCRPAFEGPMGGARRTGCWPAGWGPGRRGDALAAPAAAAALPRCCSSHPLRPPHPKAWTPEGLAAPGPPAQPSPSPSPWQGALAALGSASIWCGGGDSCTNLGLIIDYISLSIKSHPIQWVVDPVEQFHELLPRHITHLANQSATALLSTAWDFPGSPIGSSLFRRAYGCLEQCRLAWVNRLPQPEKTTILISACSKRCSSPERTIIQSCIDLKPLSSTPSSPFSEHTKGFSPVCSRWWVFSCPLCTKAFPQSG